MTTGTHAIGSNAKREMSTETNNIRRYPLDIMDMTKRGKSAELLNKDMMNDNSSPLSCLVWPQSLQSMNFSHSLQFFLKQDDLRES